MTYMPTWECFWEEACDTCPLKSYLAEHPETTYEQRKAITEIGAAATFWLSDLTDEAIANEFVDAPTSELLGSDAVAVSISSVRQWYDDNCRSTIRAQVEI